MGHHCRFSPTKKEVTAQPACGLHLPARRRKKCFRAVDEQSLPEILLQTKNRKVDKCADFGKGRKGGYVDKAAVLLHESNELSHRVWYPFQSNEWLHHNSKTHSCQRGSKHNGHWKNCSPHRRAKNQA